MEHINNLVYNDNSDNTNLFELISVQEKHLDSEWPTILSNVNNNIHVDIKDNIYEAYPFLKKLKIQGFCIAGGCICGFLNNKKITDRSYFKDIDIFVYGSREQIDINVRYFIEMIIELFPECAILYSKYLIKIYMDPQIEIILQIYNNIGEILQGFDLGSSKVAFDLYSDKLYTTPIGLFSLEYKANIINLQKCGPTYVQRLVKYWNKGYSIIFPKLHIPYIKNSTINISTMKFRNIKKINDCIYSAEDVYDSNIVTSSYSIIDNKSFIYLNKNTVSNYIKVADMETDIYCDLSKINNLEWKNTNPGSQIRNNFITVHLQTYEFYGDTAYYDLSDIKTLPYELVHYIFTKLGVKVLANIFLSNKYFSSLAFNIVCDRIANDNININICSDFDIYDLCRLLKIKFNNKKELMKIILAENNIKNLPFHFGLGSKIILINQNNVEHKIIYDNIRCILLRKTCARIITNEKSIKIKCNIIDDKTVYWARHSYKSPKNINFSIPLSRNIYNSSISSHIIKPFNFHNYDNQ